MGEVAAILDFMSNDHKLAWATLPPKQHTHTQTTSIYTRRRQWYLIKSNRATEKVISGRDWSVRRTASQSEGP